MIGIFIFWLISISIVIPCLAVLLILFRRSRANFRAALLSTTLLLLWIIPIAPFLLPFQLIEPHSSQFKPMSGYEIITSQESVSSHPTQQNPPPPASSSQSAGPELNAHVHGETGIHQIIPVLIGLLLMIWLSGSMVSFLRWWKEKRLVRDFLRRTTPVQDPVILNMVERTRQIMFIEGTVSVRQTSENCIPFVTGLYRTVLCLPESYLQKSKQEQVYGVILHEMCHLYRRDFLILHAMRFFQMIFCLHPFVYWMQKKLILLQDMACDEMAALLQGSEIQYGESLVDSVENYVHFQPAPSVLAHFHTNNTLLFRLDNILNTPLGQLSRIPFHLLLGLMLYLFLGFTAIGSLGQYVQQQWSLNSPRWSISSVISLNIQLLKIYNPFTDIQHTSVTFGHECHKLLCTAIADVDQNGYPDILAGTERGEPNFVFRNDGTGKLVEHSTFGPHLDVVPCMTVCDVNRDGDIDAIAASLTQKSKVFMNDGEGHFSLLSVITNRSLSVSHVTAGDLNNDDSPDALFCCRNFEYNLLFVNKGLGFFQFKASFIQKMIFPAVSSTIFDLNRDGKNDFILCFDRSHPLYYESRGSEKARPSPILSAANAMYAVPIKTKREQQCKFLFLGCGKNHDTHLLFDSGVTSFSKPEFSFQTPAPIRAYAVGDINQDKLDDLVLADRNNSIFLYQNQGAYFYQTSLLNMESDSPIQTLDLVDLEKNGFLDLIIGFSQSPFTIFYDYGKEWV